MNDDANKVNDDASAEDVVTEEVAADATPVDDSNAVDAQAEGDAPASEESPAEDVAAEDVVAETAADEVAADEVAADDSDGDGSDDDDDDEEEVVSVRKGPIEEIIEEEEDVSSQPKQWYILKVQVNREDSIRDALARRVKIEGLDDFFGEIIVPTEDVVEFTKSGKRKVVKRKLYPGYILVHMVINDDSWFLVRETPGIGDFTGSAGKPTPMETAEVERILEKSKPQQSEEEDKPRVNIPFVVGDRVRVKEGNFENFEGAVDGLDESNGRVIVMINIFGRQVPVEFEHWQIEKV